MATLTSSATIAITAAGTVQAETSIVVLPVAEAGGGEGRLVHPTLGTYDYDRAPDRWRNLTGDVVAPPIWSANRTLDGAAFTVWPGSIQDVPVAEVWENDGGIAMEESQLLQLIAFYTNPVDPEVDFVRWYPSYATALGYKVVLMALTAGGTGIEISSPLILSGAIEGPVTLEMRVKGYA